MAVQDRFHRWVSPTLFALISLGFLLPFATVSCDNARTTFTGIQLVTHTVPRGGVLHEAPDCASDISTCVERDASNTSTVAFVAALVGLTLGLLGIVRGPGWCAAVGFGAMVALPFEGPLLGPDVSLHSGYDMALLLFLCAGVLHARRAWRRRRERRPGRALAAHARALVVYTVIAAGGGLISGTSGGTTQSIASSATAWLIFIVGPSWLAVAGVLIRWQRQGRRELVQRTTRWDRLLWLGPFLALAFLSRKLRAFFVPPPDPIRAPRDGDAVTA